MPRRTKVQHRVVLPDPKYNNRNITRLIGRMMWDGKRSIAEHIIYEALDIIEERSKRNPIEVFEQALRAATPVIEVKPRRVGGATYQVPVEIRPERRLALARRWIVRFARQRGGKSMSEKLAFELLDASQNTGGAVKRKEETHRMAESNKAFSHFRY